MTSKQVEDLKQLREWIRALGSPDDVQPPSEADADAALTAAIEEEEYHY